MKFAVCVLAVICYSCVVEGNGRNILVFGGNGFLGATTVEQLLKAGDKVTIVNRGNWYWDTKERIKPHVDHIKCDRKQELKEGCGELIKVVEEKKFDKWDVVIDFSAFSDTAIKDSLNLLKQNARLYMFISTDLIYDVCDPPHNESIKESSGVKPEDEARRKLLEEHHNQANNKFKAEEVLIQQRADGGIPYIIFRLPDILGQRDTTYRFWMYQLWIKLTSILPDKPVNIPKFLKNMDNSFVYVEDVALMIEKVVGKFEKASEIVDQVYNLAWKESITIEHLLRTIEKTLGLPKQKFVTDDDNSILYLYPMVRAGMLDVSKATEVLHWKPTPFNEALKNTVNFYEEVMKGDKHLVQRDEIVQVGANQFYIEDKEKFYSALEKVYKINLSHFRAHDEL